MAVKTTTSCPVCGYPLTTPISEGENAVCAYCGTNLISQEGVTIPTPLFVGLIAFGLGMFLGPAIIASSTEGQRWLERQIRRG